MTATALARAVEIAKELEHRKATNTMARYEPYDYQKKFHNTTAQQRLLMAGNRIGKSFSGAMEMAYHLTGLYPELSLVLPNQNTVYFHLLKN